MSSTCYLNFSTVVCLLVLKQGIVLKVRSDWLLKLRISFAIHLRGTRVEFAPKIVVIVAGTDELK